MGDGVIQTSNLDGKSHFGGGGEVVVGWWSIVNTGQYWSISDTQFNNPMCIPSPARGWSDLSGKC